MLLAAGIVLHPGPVQKISKVKETEFSDFMVQIHCLYASMDDWNVLPDMDHTENATKPSSDRSVNVTVSLKVTT